MDLNDNENRNEELWRIDIRTKKIALALYFKYSARSIMQIALSWGFFRVEQSAHLSTSCFV